ncbi:MAG: diacylglycerol O-acyltransferase / wax synthase [Nocardioidaceae bacterium]|jgi:WS/DGAT/MGAT family acyltransferase|nr:diacylglycerol O-acyltransferase / wax synthase [Nocardioidaceae bacterium]
MQQLSSLDTQFLHIENETTVGHVGSLILLDPARGARQDVTIESLRDVLEPRLHLVAPFRQRLVIVPLGLGRPYWVDDPKFDIEFHLRELSLPSPGDDVQLGEQVSRIHARPLDRTRPLWEIYLIHGLAGGRQAIYSKVHHAAIDGVSGAEILATIMDVTAEPRVVDPPVDFWDPAPLPGAADLLTRGVVSMLRQPLDAARILPTAIPHLADLPGASLLPGAQTMSRMGDSLVSWATAGARGRTVRRRTIVTPPTPLNGHITAHRRFAFGSLPLDEVKAVKNAFGMTVNDVVMALCATVLRRWLLEHDGLPDIPIVAAVPVSVRGDGPLTDGNQISVMLVELATQIRDPGDRLAAVQLALREAKEQFEAVPASILQDVAAVIPTALAGLAAKALFAMVTVGAFPFNLFVSNVPGPQLPLYVAGARVDGIYPVSAISDLTGALNITLFSYDGKLDFGLIACRELVPDVGGLIGYLREALDELLLLAAEQGSAVPTARPRRTSRPSRRGG